MRQFTLTSHLLGDDEVLLFQISSVKISEKEAIKNFVETPLLLKELEKIDAIKRVQRILDCSLWFAKSQVDMLLENQDLIERINLLREEKDLMEKGLRDRTKELEGARQRCSDLHATLLVAQEKLVQLSRTHP